MGAQLHISLLGEFSLVYQGEPVSSLSGDRPVSLLAYLLLHRQTAVSRQHLAFTLWPDSSDSQARANLRNLFYTLRQTLPDADTYLAGDSMTLQWRSDASCELDVAAFEAALAAALAAESDAEKQNWLETAVSLYKGDLLPGNYDDWIIPLRETLRHAYLDALHQLMRLLEEAKDFRTATRYGQRLLQSDPLDERAYVQLMRLHALSGDRAGVRRLYETCVTTLRRELDVEPGPATQAAYEQLLRLEAPAPSLEPEARPAVSQLRASLLPVPATAFLGREAELAHIAELLAEPTCRLLTIVGPGGIGKTRLALQTAVGHRPVFADGVFWVSLTSLQTPDQLTAAIAEALHYRLSGTANAEAELIHVLAAKELLLVLDNFEHLLPAADFLSRLLNQTTAVKILVTSRQPLALQEEWRFDLGELPLPDTLAPEALAQNSAVQLFVQSARRVSTTFIPAEDDFPIIVRICRQVGGMPLGIELAASWMRLLSCAEIAAEIEKSLDFLAVSLRNMPPRHRSLRAVFDHSWNMLSAEEQQILLRLSIFQGGFTREAAAQVAAANLPQLSALVDRSLVQRTAVGRFNLHSIIRQFAGEHLQAAPTIYEETKKQLSHYYLRWLAEQTDRLCGREQKDALQAVAADIVNIQSSWEWGVAYRLVDLLGEAAFSLFYFCELRGLLLRGEELFGSAANSLTQSMESATHDEQIVICSMRTNQAYFALRLGQITNAEQMLRTSVDLLRSIGEDKVLSYSLRYLGLAAGANGRLAEAIELFNQSLHIARQRNRLWEMAITETYIGMIRHDQGNLSEAKVHLETAVSLCRAQGDFRLMAFSLLLSGRTNILLGELDLAQVQLEEALDLAQQTSDHYNINMTNWTWGILLRARGNLPEARTYLENTRDAFALIDDIVGVERISMAIGFLEIAAGNLSVAKTLFRNILQVKQREHPPMYTLGSILGLATINAQEGNKAAALEGVLYILQRPDLNWEHRQRAEALCTELQAHLSTNEIVQAQQRAKNSTFAAIVANALTQ